MKKTILILATMITFAFVGAANATEVTINLEDINPEIAKQVLQEKKKLDDKVTDAAGAAQETMSAAVDKMSQIEPETVDRWVSVFGKAFNNFCETINVQTNELLASPAGIALVGLLALKLGGDDFLFKLLSFPAMIGLWLLTTLVIYKMTKYAISGKIERYTYNTHDGHRVKELLSIEEPRFGKGDRGMTLFLSAAVFLIMSIVCILVLV